MSLPIQPLPASETEPQDDGFDTNSELDLDVDAELSDAASGVEDDLDLPTKAEGQATNGEKGLPTLPTLPTHSGTLNSLPTRESLFDKEGGISPGQQAPKQDISTSYQSAGSLTSAQLLSNNFALWESAEKKVEILTEWAQSEFSDTNRNEEIYAARMGGPGSEAYIKAVQTLDRMILSRISGDRSISSADRPYIVARVINEILGLGPIDPLWRDPSITEIMVHGPYRVVIERKGKLTRVPGARFRDPKHLLSVCQAILSPLNRSIDPTNPTEDGRLPDGSRVNIVHHVVAPKGPFLTIRRHREEAWTLKDLVGFGSMSEEMVADIGFLIHAGCSTVVIGGTGTGKTTVLNAISGAIPEDENIITIEDNLELQLHPDRLSAALEARPPDPGGRGAITIRHLVRNSLRMRPDRIVVGEVRGAEALDMLQAMNTGHDGSLTTFHANTANDAIIRLEDMVLQAGELNPVGVKNLIAGTIDVIVELTRYEDGTRKVSGIYEVPSRPESVNGVLELDAVPLWEFVHEETASDGTVVGRFEKRNEVSEQLVRKHRLDKKRKFTVEEVYEFSKLKDE